MFTFLRIGDVVALVGLGATAFFADAAGAFFALAFGAISLVRSV